MKEKLVFLIITSLFSNFLSIGVSFYLFTVLEVGLAGIIAFSTSLIGFFTLYLDLGLGSIYLQKNAEEDYKEYFTIYFFYKSILIIATFLPLFFIIFLLDLDNLEFQFLILKAISSIFDSMAIIWSNKLLGNKKILKMSIANLSTNLVRNGLIILIVLNYNSIKDPLVMIGLIYIIISCVSLAIFLIISKGEFQFKKMQKEKLIKFIKATRPLLISSILGVVVVNGGYLILDLSTNHDILAYYYFVDYYIINILLLISRQIRTILITIFPKEFKQKNLKEIEQITHLSERYSSIFFLSIILFVFFNAEILFQLLLPKYMESLQYVYILIFVPYFAGLVKPYASHLLPAQKQSTYSYYLLSKQILNSILILIVVPSYFFSIRMLGGGAIGLAFITVVLWGIDIPFFRIFSNKLGISWNKRIFIHMFLAGIAFITTKFIIFLFNNIFLSNYIIYISLTSLISIGIFIFGLILCKELKMEDVKFFINLLKLKNYTRSFKEELKG